MPVTFTVNRNVQGIPQLASNLIPASNSTMFDSIADSSGNFYTSGNYVSASQVNISNGVLGAAPTLVGQTCSLPIISTYPAAYVIKYNASGIAQWAWGMSTTSGTATAYNILLDPTASNVYVLVNYTSSGTITILNAATNTTGTAGTSSNVSVPVDTTGGTVLIKLNSLGVVQWVSYYTSNSSDVGYAMSVDSLGNLFVCGSTTEVAAAPFNIYNGLSAPQASLTSVTTSTVTVTLPALSVTSVSVGYLLKYSSVGVAATGVILGQPTTAGNSSSMFSSIVDPTGAFVYVVGQYINTGAAMTLYSGSATGGAVAAGSPTIPVTSSTPMGFVIKYTAATLTFVSAAVIGNGATSNNVQIYGSAMAPNGNLYVCGSYAGSVVVPIYNAPATAGAAQLQASNTISLPLLNSGTLVVGFVAKFNSALTATYASVVNPIGTATSSAMSNIYSVTVDSSDVNLFAGLRYVSSNITSGVNVTSLITSTAGTGTNVVVLPAAPSSGFGYVRYFLGNSLHASTFQNTSNIFNGVTIGGQASTNAPLTVYEDPTMTSIYLASSFTSSGPLLIPSSAVTNGLSQPPALFNVTSAGTSIQTPMVLKLS